MSHKPRTYTPPKGWNSAGDLVDFTNTCKKCGRWLPLPEFNQKHCPKCGTYVGGVSLRTEQPYKTCKACYQKNERGANFCVECGAKL